MNILSLTAGAAQMYCGSCLRDNSLAAELVRMGHQVSLIPVYTPTRTDAPNQSNGGRVLFGGISVWLQQRSALFRHLPRFLDSIWDSRWALDAASRRSISVDPQFLGSMTVAMLEGDGGPIAREFTKLEEFLRITPRPDVINLPNSLLIAMARSIRRVYDGPIVCTLQGEDLFLDHLTEPWRSRALSLISNQVGDVDAFVSISSSYSQLMARLLEIPSTKIRTVPVGVDPSLFAEARPGEPFRIGYLARIAPEKGLHLLCEAWNIFRKEYSELCELHAAGYLAPEHHAYLDPLRKTPGLRWHGELDLAAKRDYLASLNAFCVPAVYDDPKALYVLEALASAVPVVAPRRMALAEHIEACGGGILTEPDDANVLAEAFLQLARDRAAARALGLRGREGVARCRSLRRMADNTLEVYRTL